MQSIPLAVLKPQIHSHALLNVLLHAIHTACGIETKQFGRFWNNELQLHAIHTACGIETCHRHHRKCVRLPIACNPYRLRY